MSNVEWAKCRGIASDFVVFQASNSMWLKTGMEAYVEKHVASVRKIKSSDMCQNFKKAEGRHANQECKEVAMDGKSYYRSSMPKGPGKITHSVKPCIEPPFEGVKFVVQTKHEGSFYPTSELNRMVSMAKHSNSRLSNCTALSSNIFDTSFWLEEIYFQSWFANHETIDGTGDVMCVLLKELWEIGIHKWSNWKGQMPHLLSMEGVFMVKHPDIRNDDLQMMSDLDREYGRTE
jgi:hypothetical protein